MDAGKNARPQRALSPADNNYMGKIMRIALSKVLILLALLGFAAAASADERILEVWTCTTKDGKTLDDVHMANGKWVKYMNAKIAGGDIISYVLRPIVGQTTTFLFVDSYPSLASWSAGKEHESDEMDAIDEGLEAVATCTENTLHNSTSS